MVALHKRVKRKGVPKDPIEKFYSRSLQVLQSTTGEAVPELKPWMISSYEIDFGKKVGRGGFGDVFVALWDEKKVAVKILKDRKGVVPDRGVCVQLCRRDCKCELITVYHRPSNVRSM